MFLIEPVFALKMSDVKKMDHHMDSVQLSDQMLRVFIVSTNNYFLYKLFRQLVFK